MDREEIKQQITPHLPPELDSKDVESAIDFYLEINGRSYEQIAVLMAIQKKMVATLMQAIEDAGKKQAAAAMVKDAMVMNENRIIRPRGIQGLN